VPDLSSQDSGLSWLIEIQPAQHRNECGMVMAARAALRVLPLLSLDRSNGHMVSSSLILSAFRELSRCWALAAYPDRDHELKASYGFNAFQGQHASRSGVSAAAEESVVYASNAAYGSIFGAGESDGSSPPMLRAAANAVAKASEADSMVAPTPTRAEDPPYNWDASQIDLGMSARVLASEPLWPNDEPYWLESGWSRMKAELRALNEGWEVWTDWYEARLSGEQADETEEIIRATIPIEVFAQGPAATNRYIAEHLSKHSSDQPAEDGASEFGLVLATRSVLRVVPLLNTDDRIGDRRKSQFVLSVFRALAVAWARTQFPELVQRNYGVAAARNIAPFEPSSRTTAQRIGRAASEAAFCAGARSRRTADSRARVARLRAQQSVERLTDPVLFRSLVAQADGYDESDIAPGVTAAQLGAIALWPGGQAPGAIDDLWQQLRHNLLFANEGWEVWIDWYEARLRGDVLNETIELAYVNYTKRVSTTAIAWDANSEIKRLIKPAGSDLGTSMGTSEPPSASTARSFASSAPEGLPPPIESIPEQDRIGTRFGVDADGRIDVLRTPPAIDDLQRLHYDEMRHKAQQLAGHGQMLGDIATAAIRILEALPEHMEDASADRLWSRANTLRWRYDAHAHAVEDNLGPDPARLHSLVAANLGDFVNAFNVFAIGDPRLLELDQIRLGPQDRAAASKIAALAEPIAIAVSGVESPATLAAQDTLSEQVQGAIDAPNDINGDHAVELARKTTRNFVIELLRGAYAGIQNVRGVLAGERKFAVKEYRAGIYRAAGSATLTGVFGAAYLRWPQISSFVVHHANALIAFVTAAFQNPTLVEIINLIVKAARH
jgi:hypothetical protein